MSGSFPAADFNVQPTAFAKPQPVIASLWLIPAWYNTDEWYVWLVLLVTGPEQKPAMLRA